MSIDHLNSILNGEKKDNSFKALAESFKSRGCSAITALDFLNRLTSAFEDSGKIGGIAKEAACRLIAFLAKQVGFKMEPVFIFFVGSFVNLLGDKTKCIQEASRNALRATLEVIASNSVPYVIPQLLTTSCKWQSEEGRIKAIRTLNKKAPLQMSRNLVDVVPNLAEAMWNTKQEVKTAARSALKEICESVDNRDIKEFIPMLVNAIENPKDVIETIHALAGIVFVQTVESGALSIMSPILIRGFAERSIATKRQCARIVENMTKLVEEPTDLAPFLPKLLPLLEKAQHEVSDPECRDVCRSAYETLLRKSDLTGCHIAKLHDLKTMFPVVLEASGLKELTDAEKLYLEHVAYVCLSLISIRAYEPKTWSNALLPYLKFAGIADPSICCARLLEECLKDHTPPNYAEEEDDAEELCNCNFSLAYGTKILLNNTYLKLKRGFRYGLIGQNDSGKSSLLRAIAGGKVEGFPDPSLVRTVFVATDIQGELSDLSVLDYIFQDELLKDCGVPREEMAKVLQGVGFNDDSPANITSTVGSLSGGWKMKLALARAMLLKADILLLDEPTNHLDVYNVKWVENYLTGLSGVTSIMVSHDKGFLERVCTNIIYVDSLKLRFFKGNLSMFLNQCPGARKVFEQEKVDKAPFTFPSPGNLEGINTKGKPILKMTNITFTYPGTPKPQLKNVTVRCSLSSRVACVGVNGAGKSTMIKLLTGELAPDEGSGEVWKHPNARVAYVAQHAFHHIENHLSKTPNEYIRWRFQYGKDKEALEKVTMVVTEEEKAKMRVPISWTFIDDKGVSKKEKVVIKRLTEGRRQNKKEIEYEVEWMHRDDTSWLPLKTLIEHGWGKVLKEVDQSIAERAASYTKALSVENVEKHLEGFGLHREFGTHTRIQALSGGQKVKVVLAACMWNNPHLLILDEPTNYLDRESLAQLSKAIETFEGGIVMITHNNDFCEKLCPEVWHLENNTLNLKGDPEWMKQALLEKVEKKEEATEMVDALGNTIKIKPKKKTQLSRAEQRKKERLKKLRKAQGLDVEGSDEDTD
jgi:elongation factor 3